MSNASFFFSFTMRLFLLFFHSTFTSLLKSMVLLFILLPQNYLIFFLPIFPTFLGFILLLIFLSFYRFPKLPRHNKSYTYNNYMTLSVIYYCPASSIFVVPSLLFDYLLSFSIICFLFLSYSPLLFILINCYLSTFKLITLSTKQNWLASSIFAALYFFFSFFIIISLDPSFLAFFLSDFIKDITLSII